jgi:hypothetical protein
MSDLSDPSPRDSAGRLQESFDAAAEGLDLRLARADTRYRSIGLAFACFPLVAYDTADPGPVADSDDDQIQTVLRELETLTHDQFKDRWHEYLNDPYIAVTNEGMILVNQGAIDDWYESEKLAEFLKEFPPLYPRRNKIHGLKIIYNGPLQATVTYRVEEEHGDHKHTAANQTAIFSKLRGPGWRIVVFTKGGRHETTGQHDTTASP